ncbi:MAG: type IV secretion system protein VirB10 [Burkholderiales bacterium]|nr:type IV secretion system protein VirB10 [Burkholderiales bacterium]
MSVEAEAKPGDVEDRGIPSVGRKRQGNKWGWIVIVALSLVLAIALGVQAMMTGLKNRNAGTEKPAPAASTLPTLTSDAFAKLHEPPPAAPMAPTTPSPLLPPPAAAPEPPRELTAEERAAAERADRRVKSSVLVKNGIQATAASVGAGRAGAGANEPVGGMSTLGGALSATRTQPTTASILEDPNMTVTQGMFIDCVLQTAINSTLAGMTSCVMNRNVYSTNGRVLLLERGSRVVGQYQSGQLRNGMNRIFVLWTRIETPKGVLINLDSPSTDPLGRSGVDGKVDNHFWQRFGAALLISVVDDLATAATQQQQQDGGNRVQFTSTAGSSRDAASIIVENTINIPPTLDKAQGGHINIFVARDMNFGDVYELAAATANAR